MEFGGGGRGDADQVQQQLQSVGQLAAYPGRGFLLSVGDGGATGYRAGRHGGWWRWRARVGRAREIEVSRGMWWWRGGVG